MLYIITVLPLYDTGEGGVHKTNHYIWAMSYASVIINSILALFFFYLNKSTFAFFTQNLTATVFDCTVCASSGTIPYPHYMRGCATMRHIIMREHCIIIIIIISSSRSSTTDMKPDIHHKIGSVNF